ncbi:UDP-Glycosyltransferase/glycogen phosphorylase [Schizophyllum commune H4-8]|uniref:UDP-Glycosyltransferase/glycogen phosphorylase n=1 Tax=Schizophyllum commune (strain H4-8 / FGSC 9210) TaxID=578458 RepID=UPI002160E71E|nr:UDP-Glycosyltransferase/glycogen phosphorylase [Schizophyllum commune H4-8]KAI5894270.1 UDP-Glycosyltransferase/glycogen phosphorylase [Schizophyllum commune H4-8]
MAKVTARGGHSSPTFHAIDGLPPFVAMDRITEYMPLQHTPTLAACPKFARLMVPWTPDEYTAIVNDIVGVIERVDPHLIIIDNVLGQAMDACSLLKRQYHIFSPLLPSLVCPLPWYGAFVNIAHIVFLMYAVLTSPYAKALDDARAARGCSGGLPSMGLTYVAPERTYITAGVPTIDLPFDKPPNMHLCGPILCDLAPIGESDPELATWLDRGETVLVILGTHCEYSEPVARRVLSGLLGGVGSDTQILWKLPQRDALQDLFDELLTTSHDRTRVRAVTWFDAEPAAILEHPNVVCYVHHGGANSYYEAAMAGVPQVILAQWSDTYYNARVAEYRGFGVYGNKTNPPDIDAAELSIALRRVMSKEEGSRPRARAKEAQTACREAGGRRHAADIVLGLLKES